MVFHHRGVESVGWSFFPTERVVSSRFPTIRDVSIPLHASSSVASMIPPLPSDITRISAPLIVFSGDSSLGVFLADRFFRDGSERYNIEFLDARSGAMLAQMKEQNKDESQRIMKGAWYQKHSHYRPAICIFCVSVDTDKLARDRNAWLSSVTQRLQQVKSCYENSATRYISIFVCSGSRNASSQGGVREDTLIRE